MIKSEKADTFVSRYDFLLFPSVKFEATTYIHRWSIFTPWRCHPDVCVVWVLSVSSEVFLNPDKNEFVLHACTKETVHHLLYKWLLSVDFKSVRRQTLKNKKSFKMHVYFSKIKKKYMIINTKYLCNRVTATHITAN